MWGYCLVYTHRAIIYYYNTKRACRLSIWKDSYMRENSSQMRTTNVPFHESVVRPQWISQDKSQRLIEARFEVLGFIVQQQHYLEKNSY